MGAGGRWRVLIGGGLLSLAVLPGAEWQWLIAPQIVIGAGLALAISALTATALAGRSPLGIHGGWTIAARHAGICIGLLILTPIFTNQLDTQSAAAEASGTRLVLESSLSLTDKIDLGGRLADLVGTAPVHQAAQSRLGLCTAGQQRRSAGAARVGHRPDRSARSPRPSRCRSRSPRDGAARR